MPTTQLTLVQDDFSLGMVRSDAPHLIPPNGAWDIKNGTLTDDGSVMKRGGSVHYSASDPFGTGNRLLWNGHLTPGRRTFFGGPWGYGVLDGTTPVGLGGVGTGGASVTRPVPLTEIEGLLFIPGGYIYGGSLKSAPYATGTVSLTNGSKTVTGSGVTWNTLVDPGMIFTTGSGRAYVVASITDSTHLELRDAFEGTTAAGYAYSMNPLYAMGGAGSVYGNSPSYAVSTNRLLWHTATDVYFTALRATAPIANPHQTNVNDHHTMPEGAEVTGLAAIGPTVIIFTTGGVWRLSGLAYDIVSAEGTPQHSLESLSRDIILWDPAGIASWEQFLVVPATDGVYLLDGVSSPVRISKNIDPLYQEHVANGWVCGGATVYKGNYLLPILDSSGAVQDVLVTRLDRAVSDRRRKVTFPWSRLQDFGAEMSAYAVTSENTASGSRLPILLGAQSGGGGVAGSYRIANCSGYFNPTATNKRDANNAIPTFEITFRDYETGSLTTNVVRKVRIGYELVDAAADDPRLLLDYGSGTRLPNTPEWGNDAGRWGTGFGPLGTTPWTADTYAEFTPVTRAGARVYAPETAVKPFAFRIEKRLRYARFRLKTDDRPSAKCVIRRLELFTRPSQATRR